MVEMPHGGAPAPQELLHYIAFITLNSEATVNHPISFIVQELQEFREIEGESAGIIFCRIDVNLFESPPMQREIERRRKPDYVLRMILPNRKTLAALRKNQKFLELYGRLFGIANVLEVEFMAPQ